MVCPVCGEALELEGYEVGDLVDCEACGAVLRLLYDGGPVSYTHLTLPTKA